MENSDSPSECLLVIDDDVVMRELLVLLLDEEGRIVLTAQSGEAALILLKGMTSDELPSVILTDLRMPGLSEGALARRLRRVCPPPSLLIAMSGSEPVNGLAKPFDAFLRKPFTVAELTAVLEDARSKAAGILATRAERHVERPRRQRRLNLSGSEDALQIGQFPALDEAIYAKLLAVMGATQLPQLYTLFMNDAPDRIARMRSAVADNDSITFTHEAHAIKGGCGMLGATEIHALAGQMEAGGLVCSPLLVDFQLAFDRLRRILEERMMVV